GDRPGEPEAARTDEADLGKTVGGEPLHLRPQGRDGVLPALWMAGGAVPLDLGRVAAAQPDDEGGAVLEPDRKAVSEKNAGGIQTVFRDGVAGEGVRLGQQLPGSPPGRPGGDRCSRRGPERQ